MIHFKTIELSDKKDIDAVFVGNTYLACDFCFANLYAWSVKFKTQYAITKDTIFLKYIDESATYYSMPIGKMPLPKAFEMIMEDAKENGIVFQMKGISHRMWEAINSQMPNVFDYVHDRANFEYIYTSEKLINLSGKKLQSKRNHINRFKADNPDWEYITLQDEQVREDCICMLKHWEVENGIKTDSSLKYDYVASKIMLEHFDYFGLKGGAIKVHGRVIAFSIGEPLSTDSFVIHVEKAFGEINGAYTIINQQFVANEASEYTYINREEDMGLENLRKAKLSYYPDILLEEGALIPKQ